MASSKQSAGILLYRRNPDRMIEVMLVHPGGPYHAGKDLGAWSIPKGLFEDDEQPLRAAMREFREETGQDVPASQFMQLSPVKLKGGKMVHAWAAEGDMDATAIVSNTFPLEYPYKSGKWMDVPEVDKAEWFSADVARIKLNVEQAAFVTELLGIMSNE